ncbi:MAG: transglutaminase family protein, partial [Chloroflexia bacterium]|nr:transglutaminase family protein [Chloroflexia bacterium]
PGLGWIGFDPTNNLIAADRHIRTAVGRDYADVPPTRGVFKGRAESHLAVGVKVMPTEAPIPAEEVQTKPLGGAVLPPEEPDNEEEQQQEQQQ